MALQRALLSFIGRSSLGVSPEKIIVVSLFAADEGLEAIKTAYPTVTMVSSAVTKGDTKIDISRKYFGA